MREPITINYHTDSGHGWLEVDRMLISVLGLTEAISSYSYRCGMTGYLEEDCDARLLINALNEKGIPYHIKTMNPINGDSIIRSYTRWGRG